MRISALPVVAASLVLAVAWVAGAADPIPGPTVNVPGLKQIQLGPDGGTVWQDFVPTPGVVGQKRPTVVYLPPGASPTARYPVLYLLHGLPGSPWELVYGLHFAQAADPLVAAHRVRPFVAVMPPAGIDVRFMGEWTGTWERELVHVTVPWADAHLPVSPLRRDRVLAGLSAGAYGAVDIGLRHPGLAGTLESWSGYFHAPQDGSLRHADLAERLAHDPTALVRAEAPLLRRLGTRFYLSSATTHDRVTAAATRAFARLLGRERIPYRLDLGPGGHDGRFWRRHLAAALVAAFPVSGGSPASSLLRAEAGARS